MLENSSLRSVHLVSDTFGDTRCLACHLCKRGLTFAVVATRVTRNENRNLGKDIINLLVNINLKYRANYLTNLITADLKLVC